MCGPDVAQELQQALPQLEPQQPAPAKGEVRIGKPLAVLPRQDDEEALKELEKRIQQNRKFNIPKRARKDI